MCVSRKQQELDCYEPSDLDNEKQSIPSKIWKIRSSVASFKIFSCPTIARVVLFVALVLFQLPKTTTAVRVSELVPWNRGNTYEYVWVVHIVLLFVAVVLNGVSFYLVTFVEKVRRISMTNFIAALNLIDLLGALGCLIQCILNYIFKLMYGTGIACQSEAMRIGFFTFWQAGVLALISYAAERGVCAGKIFNDLQAMKMIAMCAVGSVVLAAVGIYVPHGGYHLYPSGTYCFFNMTTPLGGLSFAVGVIVPTVVMADRYLRIWQTLKRAQALLRKRGLNHAKAKSRSAFVAMKMSLFIFTFFGCALPFLVVALYEIITWQYAPYWLDITAGVALHFIAVINPLLFFAFNDEIREAFWHIFGRHIMNVFLGGENRSQLRGASVMSLPPLLGSEVFRKRRAHKHKTRKAPKIATGGLDDALENGDKTPKVTASLSKAFIRSESSAFSSSMNAEDELAEWEYWLKEKAYCPVFLSWCKANYVSENILFYIEVVRYADICSDLVMKVDGCHTSQLVAATTLTRDDSRVMTSTASQGSSALPVPAWNNANTNNASNNPAAPKIDAADLLRSTSMVGGIKNPSPLFPSCPPLAQPLEKDPDITKLWFKDLRDMASMIYEVYVQTPDAPLEVNISSEARGKIEKTLGVSTAGGQCYTASNTATAATAATAKNATTNEVQGHTHNGGVYGKLTPATVGTSTSRTAPDSSTPMSKASCGDVELGETHNSTTSRDEATLTLLNDGEDNGYVHIPGSRNDRKSSLIVSSQSKPWGQSSSSSIHDQPPAPASAAAATAAPVAAPAGWKLLPHHAHTHTHTLPAVAEREQVSSNVSEGTNLVPHFPDLWSMPIADAHLVLLEITSVYEEARGIIHKVISSDVFPRFQRTERYRAIAEREDYAAKCGV